MESAKDFAPVPVSLEAENFFALVWSEEEGEEQQENEEEARGPTDLRVTLLLRAGVNEDEEQEEWRESLWKRRRDVEVREKAISGKEWWRDVVLFFCFTAPRE